MSHAKVARKYTVRGRVQGVGYRYFASQAAQAIGVRGYVRNLDNGDVEAYAIGTQDQLAEFAGRLRQGPRWAEVRSVEEIEAPVESYSEFRVGR